MILRKATIADSHPISSLLFLAMEDIIYEFIGIKDHKKAKAFLLYFVEKENNQYSYANCLVAETEDKIVGTLNIYDGAKLEILREPIAEYIKSHFGKNFNPENETQPGEYYIDSIGVSAQYRRKGIGSKLITYVIETYAEQETIGLLVDEENTNAEKLYLSLGFEFVGRKALAGKSMKHLQLKPRNDIN